MTLLNRWVNYSCIEEKFFPLYILSPMEKGVFANSNGNQPELIAWLDEQEQKPFSRFSPRNKAIQAFDPLHQQHRNDNFLIPNRIVEIYDVGALGEEGRLGRRQRKLTWLFTRGLSKPCASNVEQTRQNFSLLIP